MLDSTLRSEAKAYAPELVKQPDTLTQGAVDIDIGSASQ